MKPQNACVFYQLSFGLDLKGNMQPYPVIYSKLNISTNNLSAQTVEISNKPHMSWNICNSLK